MENKIYELLKLDVSNLPESEPLSEQEVNNIMKRFKENNKNHLIKKRRKSKMSMVIVAAIVATCGGTTIFAAEYSNLFENLEKNKIKSYVTDDGKEVQVDKKPDFNNYKIIEKYAETEEKSAITNNDNLSISIESTYCDGRTLILGLTGSLNNGNPDGYGYIELNSIKIDFGDVVFKTEDRLNGICNYTWLEGNMMLDEGTENCFSGQITLKLSDENMIMKSKNAVITLEKILVGNDYLNIYEEFNDIELNKRIVVDQKLINGNALEQSEDGYKVRLSDYSPASIHVEWEYPDSIKKSIEEDFNTPTNIPAYSMLLLFYDEKGNEIPFLNEEIGTGSLTTPSSNIVYARILNKQESTGSDLYYGMPVYKEFKFDLSELK